MGIMIPMVVLAESGIGHTAFVFDLRIDYPWWLEDEPRFTGETLGRRRDK
jgi:hypothetical protein